MSKLIEPLPSARLWVGRAVSTPAEVSELVAQVVLQEQEPSAIEVDVPAGGSAREQLGVLGARGDIPLAGAERVW